VVVERGGTVLPALAKHSQEVVSAPHDNSLGSDIPRSDCQNSFFFLKVASGGYGNLLTVGDNLATGCLLAMLGSRIGEIRWKLAAVMVLAVIFIPLYDADSPLRRVHALRAIPDSPFLNCRNSLARRATSVPFAELHASRLAGENQLQSVPLATTILRSRFISKIWRAVGPRIGLYFLLSRRDSDAAPA
jgi:hypothetical protein